VVVTVVVVNLVFVSGSGGVYGGVGGKCVW
jgi:hypothetical protein